jgi:hypothetical protein
MRTIACVALASLLLTASCTRRVGLGGSRATGIDHAQLFTEYKTMPTGERQPIAHVLFLPPFEAPEAGGVGTVSGNSGTIEHLTLNVKYSMEHPHRLVQSSSVHIRDLKTVQGDGPLLELSRGGLFIAHVERNGDVHLTQVPVPADRQPDDPASILRTMQQHAPRDAALQALRVKT